MMSVTGNPCPCGGTHVASTDQLGEVTVTKIKKKKNTLKVSYTISTTASDA
jgi:alanyl-tRNA synthetase